MKLVKYICFTIIIDTLLLLVIAVMIELLARTFFWTPPADFFTLSDRLNHTLPTNTTFVHKRWMHENPDFPEPFIHVYTSRGWVEDYEIDPVKPANTYRIFYVGDSFTMGFAPVESIVPNIVERKLNELAEDENTRIEVINTGVPSYSPFIYYVLIRYFLMQYSPDLIVVNIDMTDNFDDWKYKHTAIFDSDGNPWAVPRRNLYDSPFLHTEEGAIKITAWKKLALWLSQHSFLYNLIHSRLFAKDFDREENRPNWEDTVDEFRLYDLFAWCKTSTWSDVVTENVNLTLDLLRKIAAFCQKNHVRLMYDSVPHFWQYAGQDDGTGAPAWTSRPHYEIANIAQEYQIPYLNSFERLEPFIKGTPYTTYYYHDDMHFNPRGNAIWAEAHVDFLTDPKHKLLPASLYRNRPANKQRAGKIAFQSDRDGDTEIYLINADLSNLVQLTHNMSADEYPVWSPDGTKIAFQSNRDGNYEIYVMDADGTNQQRLTSHPAYDASPAWSPDGTTLLFDSTRSQDGQGKLYRMNADGTECQQVINASGSYGLPAWSPDGKRIAYTGHSIQTGNYSVYTMNHDATDHIRLTEDYGACRPDWSPDSQKIAYVSQQADGKGDIWVMNMDGSGKTRITFDAGSYDYYPAWSPDGNALLYAKSPEKDTGNWELYVTEVGGQRHLCLTNQAGQDKFPDWHSGRVPDELFARQRFMYEAENSPRLVGIVRDDDEASHEKAVYAEKDKSGGFLMYGPYHLFSPGTYTARFRLKAGSDTTNTAYVTLDVVTNNGQIALARRELAGKEFQQFPAYQEFEVSFSLHTAKTLEFRVYSSGVASVWVDNVTVHPESRNNIPLGQFNS